MQESETPNKWTQFWFAASPVARLEVVRVIAGLAITCWLLGFIGSAADYHGLAGWVDRQALVELNRLPIEERIPIGWSPVYLMPNRLAVQALHLLSIASAALFTIGIAPRLTSILTYLGVISFTANPLMFGGHYGILILLSTYLAIGYGFMGLSRPGNSLAFWLGGPNGWKAPLLAGTHRECVSSAGNLALRLLQVHWSILLVTTGLHKLQSGEWWAGDGAWFTLFPAGQASFDRVMSLRGGFASSFLFVLSILTYLQLAWQLFFPFLMFNRATRRLGLVLGVLGSLSLLLLGEWFYSLAILSACMCFVDASVLLDRLASRIKPARAGRVTNENQAGLAQSLISS